MGLLWYIDKGQSMIIYDNPINSGLMGLLWYIDKGQSMIIY